MFNKFLSWWPVMIAVLFFAASIGGQQVTIASQKDMLVEQATIVKTNTKAIVSLKETQARIDERTLNIQTQQKQAQKTLDEILKELRTR